MMSDSFQRLLTAACREHLKAVRCETALQGTHDLNLIVNNQDARSALTHDPMLSVLLTGNVKRKIAPPPSRSSTQIRPPCASTSPRHTARPNPEPVGRTVLDCVSSTR